MIRVQQKPVTKRLNRAAIPLYMNMMALPLPDEPRPELWPVARSLRDGPDYRPHWRSLVVERHLVEIMNAENQWTRFETILLSEKDPIVRQFLLFHTNRRSVIDAAIKYSLRAWREPSGTQALIKAMIICGATNEHIAQEVGTTSLNILVFSKTFFDLRRFLHLRGALRRFCFPILPRGASAYAQYEARLLAISFERGIRGLRNLALSRQSSADFESDCQQINALLAARALDHLVALEASGVPPNENDLRWFFVAQDRLPAAGASGNPNIGQRSTEPPNPEAEKKREEVNAAVRKLSPLARRRIIELLERARSDVPLPAEEGFGVGQEQNGV